VTTFPTLAFIAAAVLVSPLLASLTHAREPVDRGEPIRAARARDRVVLACLAATLATLAIHGQPWPAWWLFAVGGAAISLTDIRTHRIPRRWLYPLAGAITICLIAGAMVQGHLDDLLRACAGVLIVGGAWLGVALVRPVAVGLGDVRLAGLTGALTGWLGWTAILEGQLAAMILAIVTGVLIAVRGTTRWGRTMAIPMGPALVAGALMTTWL
jgi:leader peptidase (prepilin peptidase)/N-methyltransferase